MAQVWVGPVRIQRLEGSRFLQDSCFMGVGLGLVVLLGCWIRFARWQATLEVTRRYVWGAPRLIAEPSQAFAERLSRLRSL